MSLRASCLSHFNFPIRWARGQWKHLPRVPVAIHAAAAKHSHFMNVVTLMVGMGGEWEKKGGSVNDNILLVCHSYYFPQVFLIRIKSTQTNKQKKKWIIDFRIEFVCAWRIKIAVWTNHIIIIIIIMARKSGIGICHHLTNERIEVLLLGARCLIAILGWMHVVWCWTSLQIRKLLFAISDDKWQKPTSSLNLYVSTS